MWFKNLSIYKLDNVSIDESFFCKQLAQHTLRACGKTELSTIGWISPFGRSSMPLCHIANKRWLIAAAKEERLLPAAVVNDFLKTKIEEIELEENRQVFRKEKSRLKEEIIFDLLPKAFTRKVITQAYIDWPHKLLVIDTASPSKAEALIQLLRETLGSLSLQMLETKESPQHILTDWVATAAPNDFEVDDYCEMIDPKQEGASLKCHKHDLSAADILGHLEGGKRIKKVAVCWRDSLSCVIEDNLTIRRIRPLSVLQEKRKEHQAETTEEILDADFVLMCMEFAAFFTVLFREMGGLKVTRKTQANAEDQKIQITAA